MDSDDPLRYKLRIEIQAAIDTESLNALDDERDHLSEIDHLLMDAEDPDCDALREQLYQQRSYDLCHECYEEYVRNPLAIESQMSTLDFSEN